MIIREPELSDKPIIDRIYNEFYSNNEYPDFFNGCSFVVTDDAKKIIVAGGVKSIAEAVFVTDRKRPPFFRLDALLQGLGSTIHIANGMGYQQIHAFVSNDESYVRVLQRFGFKLIDAKLLVLDFGESNGQAKTT